jgi:oxalate decarboxylase/phosphoglucose isomerase-like protein (cupin superfamily)
MALAVGASRMLTALVLGMVSIYGAGQEQKAVSFKVQEDAFKDADFVFDLDNSKPVVADMLYGGIAQSATITSFPAIGIEETGGPSAGVQLLTKFKPCEFRTPHIHPRGVENFFILQGTIRANFFRENGSLVSNLVPKGSSGFFPQGYIHFTQNPTCEDAETIQIFTGNDPGVIEISALRWLPIDIVRLTLSFDHAKPNMKVQTRTFQQDKSCLQKCRDKKHLASL